jgi:hypothetical protein
VNFGAIFRAFLTHETAMPSQHFHDSYFDGLAESAGSFSDPVGADDILAPARAFSAAWGADPLPWSVIARALFEGERRLRAAGASRQSRRLRSLFARWGLLAHWADENRGHSPAAEAVESALRGMALSLAEPIRRSFTPAADWISAGPAASESQPLDLQSARALENAVSAAIASADFLLDQAPGAFQNYVDLGLDPQREGLVLFAGQAERADARAWPSAYASARSRAPAEAGKGAIDLDRLSERPDGLLRALFQSQRASLWLSLTTLEIAMAAIFILAPTFLWPSSPPNWRHALFFAGARAFFGFAAAGALSSLVELGLIFHTADEPLRQAMGSSSRLRESIRRSILGFVCFMGLGVAAVLFV